MPEERRIWLCANLGEHYLRKGEVLMREGQRVTHQFILLDGELVTEKMLCGRQVFDDRRVAPTSIAETALLADMPLCY